MRQALEMALEALEKYGEEGTAERYIKAKTAIKEALAQPEQETCKRCNGNGMVGNILDTVPCPFCKGTGIEAQPEQEPVAWEYDVTYNQDGTVSVALPDGDELRIVLPNQQEPVSLPVKLPWDDNPEKHPHFYTWTWDVMVSGGKWRAEYGWKKPTEKVVNLQPLYTTPPQHKPLTDEQIEKIAKQNDAWVLLRSLTIFDFVRAIEAAHGIKE